MNESPSPLALGPLAPFAEGHKSDDNPTHAYPVLSPPVVDVYSPSRNKSVAAKLTHVSPDLKRGFVRYVHNTDNRKWVQFSGPAGLNKVNRYRINQGLTVPAAESDRDDATSLVEVDGVVLQPAAAQEAVKDRASHARWYVAGAAALVLLIGTAAVAIRGCDTDNKDAPAQPKQPPAKVVPGK